VRCWGSARCAHAGVAGYAVDRRVGAGLYHDHWYGLFGPRGLPAPVLARLGAEIAKARDDPTLAQRTAAAGMTMILTPPEALRAKMEAEVPRWKKLVPELGIKAE